MARAQRHGHDDSKDREDEEPAGASSLSRRGPAAPVYEVEVVDVMSPEVGGRTAEIAR
ncbi:MAG TPA: hypothetical protein VLM79_03535 [Kofleriaceae bacterium]|nr:hypothetical protein [Kofleriaceae bacterium]